MFWIEFLCLLMTGANKDITGTETTRSIEKHFPTAVPISSNLRPDLLVLRSSNPRELISSFLNALENLATEVKTQMRAQIFEIVTRKEVFEWAPIESRSYFSLWRWVLQRWFKGGDAAISAVPTNAKEVIDWTEGCLGKTLQSFVRVWSQKLQSRYELCEYVAFTHTYQEM